jgi:hypothetical protein
MLSNICSTKPTYQINYTKSLLLYHNYQITIFSLLR